MKLNFPTAAAVFAGVFPASLAQLLNAFARTAASGLLDSATHSLGETDTVFINKNPFAISKLDVSAARYTHQNCWPKLTGDYVDWKTYNANGVNLGCWLELEYSCYEEWWASLGTSATDEWSLCQQLGAEKCADVCETHYATFINTSTIDALASVGVNTLRIPTTYAAWIDVPGSELYHGQQRHYLRHIMNYAIRKHQMHITLGLHSLPGKFFGPRGCTRGCNRS